MDVFGTDPELQAMVPSPILSLLLLYPLTENTKSKEIGTISPKEDCYFMKQSISNACGTIAILHSLANNSASLNLDSKFLSGKTINRTADAVTSDAAFTTSFF